MVEESNTALKQTVGGIWITSITTQGLWKKNTFSQQTDLRDNDLPESLPEDQRLTETSRPQIFLQRKNKNQMKKNHKL